MKCPKCGATMRPSKKYPGYYLCDTCRKRYPGSSGKQTHNTTPSKRRSNKRKKKSRKLPLFILLLFILTIGGFALFKSGFFSSKDVDETTSEPQTIKLTSGETGTINGTEVKILSTKVSSGTKRIKPKTGNVFLMMEVQITNTTDKSISIHDVSDFRAYYQEELVEHSALSYAALSSKKPRLTGIVEAKQSLTGFICYELPKDFNEINLEFSYPVWSNQKISFSITQ